MRLARSTGFLLLLAALFVLAVLRRRNFPGEEVLPDLYRAAFLAQAGDPEEPPRDAERLRNELEAARHRIRVLEETLRLDRDLVRFFVDSGLPRPPQALRGWVYALDPDEFRRAVWISIGEEHGVGLGMPVVAGSALLGRVESVTNREAIVRLLDHREFRIEVEVRTPDGAVAGVVRGAGRGTLDLLLAKRTRGLRPGQSVFTTAFDPAVPPGLLVGRIVRVEDLDRDGISEVSVEPAAPIDRLAHVAVLRTGRMR